jgi:hypothetical protein
LLVISRTVLADKEETGDILMALRTVSNEIGDNANSHLELAQKIEAEVVQPLRNFSENYIAQVRECQQHLERISESRDEYASRIVEVTYNHVIPTGSSGVITKDEDIFRLAIGLMPNRRDWVATEPLEHQE